MARLKLTNIMLGVLCGIIVYISLFNFLDDGIVQYGVTNTLPDEYNASYNVVKGELSEINKTVTGIKNQIKSISAQSGLLDYLGFFFNAGYKALSGAGQITSSVFIITDSSLNSTESLGSSVDLIKQLIYASVIIIFFVGILMHAVIKSDRI